ncbi:molybdopterin oxidoreductase [Brumimicrobium salinarum]|uniref:Molybdopterin oxidoreductase n=1 Tax=Brumimicrobium salinarum TaxID=2058658 RepID=A0A2I0R631_9FLAO|nr:TAT-variant-translocated molybdopterin oxidoreductase [Brumimicrobium salinarum]PKR82029.1 molybdopterin oxidoreductase [Brumimicrobium salinarum]
MGKKYWKGLDELNETPEFLEKRDNEFGQDVVSVDEFLADDKLSESSTPRRDFLKFLGFSVAAATIAACEAPVTKAIPYVNKPVDVTPGVATWYASTYYDGNAYANILVKTREGRPIYIKGNKDFGFTNGSVTPQIIASVLSLYNEARLQYAFKDGQGISTADADSEIKAELNKIKQKGGKVVLVSNTLASPSSYKAVQELEKSITGRTTTPSNVDSGKDKGFIGTTVDNIENALGINEETEESVQSNSNTGASFEHIQYDSVSYAGIRKANELSFGKSMIPDYDFSKAKTIVSFGADFLSTWLMSTQYASQYSQRRDPDGDWMSKHYQVEANMSITGTNADVRLMMKPSEEAGILAALIKEVGGSANGVSASVPERIGSENITKIAKDLKKGNGLVVSGSNNTGVQVLVNKLNHLIGAYSSTINVNNPVQMFASEDDKMMKFVSDVLAKKGPDAVIFYGVNPVYTAPNGVALAEALSNTALTISTASVMDETAAKCKYVVPDHHALEAWNDFSPKANEFSLAQPTIRPLYDTVAAQESFLVWAGKAEREGKDSRVFFNFIKENWSGKSFEGATNFDEFWNTTIHNSVYSKSTPAPSKPNFDDSAFGKISKQLPKGGDLEVVLYQKSAIGRGDQAANPWLQETPDPITKVTWDNYITMNPTVMEEQGYNEHIDQEHGCTLASITVGEVTYELPVFPSPGQAPGTVGIALGYGRGEGGENIGKAAFQTKEYGGLHTDENGNPKPIGKNAFRMIQTANGVMEYSAPGSIENKNTNYLIATTQIHRTVMARNSIVRETTLDTYANHSKDAYNPDWTLQKIDKNGHHVEAPLEEFNLWDDHPVENVGHRWGMTIDLNACIGCGSCLVACQAENNVPVVGKDEVRRGREMHWLRIDRYYASDDEATVGQRKDKDDFSYKQLEIAAENPKVIHQPMMCHHCNHAPCETVCPVSATTHSNEGLNQMAYNRCIGTRYCANNCPYKVRRFNWFNYPSYKKFGEVNPAQDELGRMVLNPDVTVRTRGVMEKCSFCVQRIQEGKLTAKKDQRPVEDGDVTTACGDACPSNAIIVGDWNDPNSKIRRSADHKRSYQALEEIGVKPNMWYKVKVRNEENDLLASIQLDKEHTVEHNKEEAENSH